MSLSEEDKNWFESSLDSRLGPLQERTDKAFRAVFGENGEDGGLRAEIKSVKKRLGWVEKFTYMGQGAIGAFLAFKSKILGG